MGIEQFTPATNTEKGDSTHSAGAAYEAYVLGASSEANLEANLEGVEVLKTQVAELQATVESLRAELQQLREQSSLEESGKLLADKQPRRIRNADPSNPNSPTERYVKYADGTFDWVASGERSEATRSGAAATVEAGGVVETVPVQAGDAGEPGEPRAATLAGIEQTDPAGAAGGVSLEAAQTQKDKTPVERKTVDYAVLGPDDYKTMGLAQLAKAASEAAKLGDRAAEEQVREAAMQRLQDQLLVSSTDNESPEAAQKRYEEELAHYESMVGRFSQNGQAAQEQEATKASFTERVKNWFKKEYSALREFGGAAYFAEKWHRVQNGFRDNVLDFGVNDEMDDEEKQERRKRNRVGLIIGGAAVSGLAVWAAYKGLSSSQGGNMYGSDTSASQLYDHYDPSTHGMGIHPDNLTPSNAEIYDSIRDNSGTGVENLPLIDGTQGAPEVATLPVEAFNIPKGTGGEELFTRLGIEPSKWYGVEKTLVDRFPSDFYMMESGHVGISHSGWLSQEAQDFIKTVE